MQQRVDALARLAADLMPPVQCSSIHHHDGRLEKLMPWYTFQNSRIHY